LEDSKEFFVCYENDTGIYESGFVKHQGVKKLSHKELINLEDFIVSLDDYEGDSCNIVSHIPFSEEKDDEVSYLFRYFINGEGSLQRGDFTYEGGIANYEDVLTLEDVTATQLGVESITVFSFEELEVNHSVEKEVE